MLPALPGNKWDFEKAAHLLNRAGFGGPPDAVESLRTLGLRGAVESLLYFTDEGAHFALPDFTKRASPFTLAVEPWLEVKPDMQTRLRVLQIQNGEQAEQMRAWWLNRMAQTPNPLREKMTLFWHGHFATGMQKVDDAYLMWLQNDLFRTHATGNFGELTKAISRDPAMMIYLDINRSNKAHPNENFAREVMELFTLGIGNYTEQDIQEAARAFTGYRIDPFDKCSFKFNDRDHDHGLKTFMSEQSDFTGDQILDKILSLSACSKFIAKKVWRFFASENPPPTLVERLATALHDGKYEIRPLLREIFTSAEFYSNTVMYSQIKSPVQYVVQAARQFEVALPMGQVQNALRQMGQVLFAPPNVKGWDGGRAWINTQTLLARYNLADAYLRGGKNVKLDLQKIAPPDLRSDADRLIAQLCLRLLHWPPEQRLLKSFTAFLAAKKPPFDDETVRGLLHVMMSTPQFQLC
jgi:uncharacterized protein (DUF1800 family)